MSRFTRLKKLINEPSSKKKTLKLIKWLQRTAKNKN